MEFRPTVPSEIGQITELMCRVFHSPADAQTLDPTLLHWKFFVPRSDWRDPRSFGLFSKGSLVAHACLWPVTLSTANGEIKAPCLVDWTSDPKYPGMGVLLVKKLAALYPALLSVGGSADTRAIMPKLGFRKATEIRLFSRVISATGQFRARGIYKPKEFARLARNWVWSQALLRPASGWTATPGAFGSTPVPSASAVSFLNPAALEYLKRCPKTRIGSYTLVAGGMDRGGFVVCASGTQARIAALHLESATNGEWDAAVSAATRTLRSTRGICEIAAGSSSPDLAAALAANGFRLREIVPVFLLDARSTLSSVTRFDLNWLDDDTSFLWFPDSIFMT